MSLETWPAQEAAEASLIYSYMHEQLSLASIMIHKELQGFMERNMHVEETPRRPSCCGSSGTTAPSQNNHILSSSQLPDRWSALEDGVERGSETQGMFL